MTTMEDIQATQNFSTQVHILANDFHLSNKDASAMVLERVYHRLQSGKEFNDWVTTWSRKDCERALSNEYQYKADHVADGIEMDNIPNSTNEGYQEVTPEQLKQIFPDSRAREFVQSVLSSGKENTMDTFNLTKQQFNSRLNHRIKYCHDHSDLINRVLDTDERKELIKQQRLIQVLLDDVSNSEIDDQGLDVMIATFFDYYPVLHDWLENAKEQFGLRNEAKVVKNFSESGQDGRRFIDYIYRRLNIVQKKLEGSNIND